MQAEIAGETSELEQAISQLADRLGRATNDAVARALEARIEELTRRQAVLADQTSRNEIDQSLRNAGTTFRRVQHLLQNPLQVWKTGSLETQKLVTRIVFTSPPTYDRESGYGTPELSPLYRISRHLTQSNSCLVDITDETWEQLGLTIFDLAHLADRVSGDHAA